MELLSCIIWILIGIGVLLKETHKESPGRISGIGAIMLLFAVGWIALMAFGGGLISALYSVFEENALLVFFLIAAPVIIVIVYRIHKSWEYGIKLDGVDYGYQTAIGIARKNAVLAQKQILLNQKREELLRLMEYWVPSREQLEKSSKWRLNVRNYELIYSFEECVQDAWNEMIRRDLSNYEFRGLIRDLEAFKASWTPPANTRPLPYEIRYYEKVLAHYLSVMEEKKPSFFLLRSLMKRYPEESFDEVLNRWREETACELTEKYLMGKDRSFPIRQIQERIRHEELAAQVLQDSDEPKRKYRRRRLNQNNSTDP